MSLYIYIHINMCLRPNIKRSRVLELPNGIRTKCKKIYRQHKECSLLYIYINMYILESCFWHTLTVRSIQLGSILPRSLTSLKVANLSQTANLQLDIKRNITHPNLMMKLPYFVSPDS